MEPADTTVDTTREAGAGSMSPASSGSPFFRLPEVGDVYLWHTGHRVVVTAVEGAMSYVRWSGQTTGNMRMPIATGLLAAVAPVKANADALDEERSDDSQQRVVGTLNQEDKQ